MDRRRILAAASARGLGVIVPPLPSPWSATRIYTFVRSGSYNNIVNESSSAYACVMSEIGKSSGKYYWEMEWTGSTGTFDSGVGIRRADEPITSQLNVGQTCTLRSTAVTYAGSSGATIVGGSAISFAAGDLLSVALDMDNFRLWIRKGSTWPGSGNPATGAFPLFSGFSGGPWHAYAWADNNPAGNHRCTINTGFSPFTYAVPAGFTAGLPL